MSMNRYFNYVMNLRPIAGVSTEEYTVRPEKDFHCFDIAGVPNIANIENVYVDIFFPSRPINKISSEPIRAHLIGTASPGNSSWLFPFFIAKNDAMTVSVENTNIGALNFDLTFLGYHRERELPPGGCPPDKDIYYYVFDFGDVAAAAVGIRSNIRINSNFDYVALGTVATANAAANDTLEFKWEIDSRSERWMKEYIMGNALFQNPLANPRRIFWRIPQLFRAKEEISLYLNDIGGAGAVDTEVAIFGYHVPKGTSNVEVMADFERWQNVNWQ